MNQSNVPSSIAQPRTVCRSASCDTGVSTLLNARTSSAASFPALPDSMEPMPHTLSAEEIGLVSGGSFAAGISGAALGTIGGATAGRIAGIAIGSAAGGPIGAIIGLGIGIGWVFATSGGAGSRYRITTKLR